MEQPNSHYGLRARNHGAKRQRRNALSAEELKQPAAKATIGAGLRPGALTKAERLQFSSKSKVYVETRSAILEKWEADVSRFLTLEACLEGAEAEQKELIQEAWEFLSEHAYINFGLVATDNESEASSRLTDEELHSHLVNLLLKVNLDEWTEKKIRKELEQQLNTSLSDKKQFIREKVMAFLQGDREALPPGKGPARSKGKVIVVGAGPAGLAAALHLQRRGVEVVVLEARQRPGGRVHTSGGDGLSQPVDLGASIITGTQTDEEKGLRPDPSAVLARQLGLQLHELRAELPLFDGVTGQAVGFQQDERIERVRDALMDAARARVEDLGEAAVAGENLGNALDQELAKLEQQHGAAISQPGGDPPGAGGPADLPAAGPEGDQSRAALSGQQAASAAQDAAMEVDVPSGEASEAALPAADAAEAGESREGLALSESDRRLLDWHWANLEYGCSARLSDISLPHWNQDEEYGGFGGPHCMVRGGYGQITDALAAKLQVQLGAAVSAVTAAEKSITVKLRSGEVVEGDAVIVTVPLGCLKAGHITFSPPLPAWKQDAIQTLGFGTLNKVLLEFPERFWEDQLSYFGVAAPGGAEGRGSAFMFWNLQPLHGACQLTALISGAAAMKGETAPNANMVTAALQRLRAVFGADKVPEPSASTVTRWASDEFSGGSYSYVAVGASAETYDLLAKPVHRRVLFAGEHTCKEHPDTVGGAMLTGLREAVRALAMLKGDSNDAAEAEQAQAEVSDAEAAPGDKRKAGKTRSRKRARAEAGAGEDVDTARPQRRAAVTAAEAIQDMERREASREEVKALLKAVMSVGAGSSQAFVAMAARAEDPEARARLLSTLLMADTAALGAIAADEACMGVLAGWVPQLVADRPAFHVLEQLLKVLLQMPCVASVLDSSGMQAAVRKAGGHPLRPIKAAVEKLGLKWGGVANGATKEGPGHAPEQKLQQAKPDYDSEYEREMEKLRHEREQAAELARQYEEHARQIEAELHSAAVPSDKVLIQEFDSFAQQRGKPRLSAKEREEKLARRREQAQKLLEAAERQEAKQAAKAPSRAHANGHSAAEVVAEYVKEVLKPVYAAKKIDKDGFKSIARSAVHKVLSQRPPTAPAQLNDKEKGKIRDLVDKYVKRHRAGAS